MTSLEVAFQTTKAWHNRIGPGALHWTLAGRGILHEEVPEQRAIAALGLQVFVNLPSALKHAAPRFIHAEWENLPVLVREGTTVRAVIESSNGIASPLAVPTRAFASST